MHASGVDSILAAETKDRTRLVLNLDKLVPYDTRVDGNNIIVSSVRRNNAAASTVRRRSCLPSRAAGGAAARAPFAASTSAAARTAPAACWFRLTDPHTHINLRQVGNQIVVDFDADLPKNLARRYDSTDFGTPISSFDATRVGTGTRIAINATGDYEQLAYQSDDQYVVEIQPQRKVAATQDDKPQYTGERLTLNFQEIETRAVLQLLADASGQNIVVSDSVSGNVTLRLQNVPWDHAAVTRNGRRRRSGPVISSIPSTALIVGLCWLYRPPARSRRPQMNSNVRASIRHAPTERPAAGSPKASPIPRTSRRISRWEASPPAKKASRSSPRTSSSAACRGQDTRQPGVQEGTFGKVEDPPEE